MKISQYKNFGDHHFGTAAMEGIEIENFKVERAVNGFVHYATATVTSKNTGEIYRLRFKLNGGEEDTVCSCPACAQRQYFCKHMAALLNSVAEWQMWYSEQETLEQEQYAEFGFGYVSRGGLATDVPTAYRLHR